MGKKGESIKRLTKTLKKRFDLENPQIEIAEVENINLDAKIISERIASSLEKFGISKFKAIGHKAMTDVMNAGALGVEIIISGKIPSSRAKSWRFYQGYLKKCGDISITGVRKANMSALLKTGIIGIKVRIMPPDIKLPDRIIMLDEKQEIVEEVQEGLDQVEEKPKEAPKKKRAPRKKKVES